MLDTPLFAAESKVQNGHKVVIIDGHALAYRSYFAFQNLSTSKGVSTNAVFGFLKSLLRILKEEGENDATVVAFDAPAKTFRHEQYADYKAGRAPTPEDLPHQITTIKEMVRLMGLYQIEQAGLEADDLIGTMAKRCEAKGYKVEIVTSDRDSYQLVNENITVRGLDKTDRYGPDEVFKKYGVRVDQWVDFRSLTGDSSDNIPGAKGIGPVSAQKLLQKYETLDFILNNLDSIEPKGQAQKIKDSLEDVKFSKELSCIVTDADIEIAPERWAKREMNKDGMRQLLQDLEFGSISRDLGLTETESVSYKVIPWSSDITGTVGFVLSDVNPMLANVIDLAVASDDSVAIVPPEARLEYLQHKTLHGCDAKALSVYANHQGFETTPGDDPLLMAYVLDPNTATAESAARRYGAGEWGSDARGRAIVTSELFKAFSKALTGKQKEVYETIEKPLQEVLVAMELKGITLDSALLRAQASTLAKQLEDLENSVRDIAENPLMNLNSRDQVAELLYDRLQLQAGKKTTTGKQSTAVGSLEPLRDKHPVVAMILDYRELSKLKSTYLDPLPKLVNVKTGRLHTTFQQTIAATGRLSSINPNLQNIPVRTDIGREIRKAFVAPAKSTLLVADYSQIELRVLAHIADEPALIEAFKNGEDIHARTAARVYGVEMNAVQPDMRRVAKIINFGVLYGMSAHRLTNELSISYEEAEAFIKNYFAGYPKVRHYIDSTLESCRKTGYVETLLGRRRMIADINSGNRNAREYAERMAYNMPIQGTAADIMKLAMLHLAPKLKPFEAHLLLQVHDELVVEVPEDKAKEVSGLIIETMENAYGLKVPLVAGIGQGQNWLEAK